MNTIKSFDEKSLAVALKAITKSAVVTRDKIQEVAVWAVNVSITDGNIAVANALLDAIGGTKSLRKDSLVAYFEKLGNFAWVKADKKLAFFLNTKHGITDRVMTEEYAAIIVGTKWDEAKREAEIVSEYDMEKQTRIFIARMEKVMLDPANKVANADVLHAVRNAFNKINAEKVLKTMTVDNAVIEQGEKIDASLAAREAATLPVIVPAMVAAVG